MMRDALRVCVAALILSGLLVYAWAQRVPNEIEVRVLAPDRWAVDQVPVFLLGDDYTELGRKYTDAGGRCFFRGLSQGVFYIQVEPKGNEWARQTFRIQMGDVMTSGGEKYIQEVYLIPRETGSTPPGLEMSYFHQQVPDHARDIYETAIKALERKDFASAESSLKRALQIFPDYYDALDRLGSEYVQQKVPEQAIPLLQHATKVNQKGWHSWYILGAAQCELGEPENGITALKRAAQLNPRSPNIRMRMGLELSKDPKSYEEAVQALVTATGLAGRELPDAYFTLASLYTKLERYSEAAEALQSYLDAVPNADREQKENYRKAIQQLRTKAQKQNNDERQ